MIQLLSKTKSTSSSDSRRMILNLRTMRRRKKRTVNNMSIKRKTAYLKLRGKWMCPLSSRVTSRPIKPRMQMLINNRTRNLVDKIMRRSLKSRFENLLKMKAVLVQIWVKMSVVSTKT